MSQLQRTMNGQKSARATTHAEKSAGEQSTRVTTTESRVQQQLANVRDSGYKTTDRQPPADLSIPKTGSSVDEVELSVGALRNEEMSCVEPSFSTNKTDYTVMSGGGGAGATLLSGTSSPYHTMPVRLSGRISSVDSQSTHSSDFHPPFATIGGSSGVDDGEKILQSLANAPPTLETALTINQTLQRRITRHIARLEDTLRQNLRRQLELHDEEEENRLTREEEKHMRDSDSRYFLRISSFCQPYFKTKSGMPAPMNEDAKFKTKHGYLDLHQTRFRPWSRGEQRRLRDMVLGMARDVQLATIASREGDIRRLVRNLSPSQQILKSEQEDKLLQCSQEVLKLKTTTLRSVPVPQNLKLDWIAIAAQVADGHRTPDECEQMWEVILTPNISELDFSEKDDIAIQSLVRSYGRRTPDWTAIAAELSEPRSPYQVFRRYQSFIAPTLNPTKWCSETKQQLIELVQKLSIGEYIPWTQVQQQMTGFSRQQLQGQWKKLNPSRKRGSFTGQEDFTFLKCLLRFGPNIMQIARFLPQRNCDQIKERFRRTIISCLLLHWTSEMDAELTKLTSTEHTRLSTSFWRRLALVPGFASTGKDAAMLRLRFNILKLWKETTLQTQSPPPLFPVTITTSETEIQELKHHFVNAEMVAIRAVVDKINAGNHIREALYSLEERRQRLHKEHDHHHNPAIKRELTTIPLRLNHLHLHHMHQTAVRSLASDNKGDVAPIDLRKVSVKRPAPLTWPEQLILDFFMPSTVMKHKPVNLDTDLGAVRSIRSLMTVLQVRPLPVQPSEVQVLSRLNIQEQDISVLNSTQYRHTCSATDVTCVWCKNAAVPECVPLLPPSAASLYALQSLLLHRVILQSMAQGTFVLHKFTGADVRLLGEKVKPVRSLLSPHRPPDDVTIDVPRPGTIGKVHITTVLPKPPRKMVKKRVKGKSRLVHAGPKITKMKKKREKWNKRSMSEIYKSFKTGKATTQYQGPKKPEEACVDNPAAVSTAAVSAEQAAENTQTVGGAGGTAGDTEVAAAATKTKKIACAGRKKNGACKARRGRPPGRKGKKKIVKIADRMLAPAGREKERQYSPDASSGGEEDEDEDSGLTSEELKEREHADNLLWHRFLAVFLWPAALTLNRPSSVQIQDVEEQVEEASKNRIQLGALGQQGPGQQHPHEAIAGATGRILQEAQFQVKEPSGRRRKRARSEGDQHEADQTQGEELCGSPPTKLPKLQPSRVSTRMIKTVKTE